MPAADAIAHLIGMQAQAPNPPYVGLWTRLEGFRPGELAGLLEDRKAVRTALMRSTVHLVTADDCLMLRPLLQPALDRALAATRFGRDVAGLAAAEVTAAVVTILAAAGPLTPKELGAALAERWPDRDPDSLVNAARSWMPLVQVPPRGIWGVGGQTRYAASESWLGRPVDAEADPDTVVRRYLAAYGPATVKDVQTWSGLTRLREVLERLRPGLRVLRDEDGNELFDVPDAPLPGPDTAAPVRFLPEFDNILLSHANRTRVIDPAHQPLIFTRNGIIRSTFLVDGFVHGRWNIAQSRDEATLTLEPFTALTARQRNALSGEGERLLSFAAEGAASYDIRFEPPDSR
jgi:hypothetical protein